MGVVFLAPFAIFLLKKVLSPELMKRAIFLFALGGLQGFIGWFMVSSGLEDLTSVSHIRLGVHLITAFITFGFTLYFALELIEKKPEPGKQNIFLKKSARILFSLVIIQILYGAFVAGLHAGKIHTTFPLMSGQFIPTDIGAYNGFFNNIFDNPVTVQFIHRLLAFSIVLYTVWIFIAAKRNELHSLQKSALTFLVVALSIQFILGVVS